MWRKQSDIRPVPTGPEPLGALRPAPSPQSFAVSAPPSLSAGTEVTRITNGLRLKGNFSGSGDLYLDVELEGKVQLAAGSVTVGPKGRVQGDIKAREIHVQGKVEGKLEAAKRTVLSRTANVAGNISSPALVVEEGARYRGQIDILEEPSAVRAAPVLGRPAEHEKSALAELQAMPTSSAKESAD